MSPTAYLASNSPKLLVMHGEQDTTVPVKHARYLQQQAKKVHAPVEALLVDNGKLDPSRDEIIERTVQFFLSHR